MSVVFSGTFSGRFTSTGSNQFIPLPSGVDWMTVTNETVSYAAGGGSGAKFTWQYGDATGRGTLYTKEATIGALVPSQIAASSGFYFVNQSQASIGALNNGSTQITAISNATPPRVTCGSTAGMPTGTIVRLYNITNANQLNGYDFTITNVSGTTFDLANAPTLALAGTTGSFRVIANSIYFYPAEREIMKVEKSSAGTVPAGSTRITFGVTHGYLIGQKVTLVVPSAFGMVELNGQTVTITNIGQADANAVTNTIDVDVDSSGYTAFAFPVNNSADFTPAQAIPVGMNTATALNQGKDILTDATLNTAQFGMLLVAGASSPAGVANDVITWIAGKSFNGV